MKIKVIDFGYKDLPKRAHYNDAGADVYACFHDSGQKTIMPHTTIKVPLGMGLELPDGYMACVFPRSGLSCKDIVCELPPIDSGYRGEIHAIVHNGSDWAYRICNGDKIGQLIIMPIILADFVEDLGDRRDSDGFGSTGM